MYSAREIDRVEVELVQQGAAFFHVSGAGHESSAAVAQHLQPHDWLHPHYRDKALLLARGVGLEFLFRQQLARATCTSGGRQLPGLYFAPDQRIVSMPTPVGSNAVHAVGVAAAIKHDPGDPIVVCCAGDGSTQQGEFLEAVAEAVRSHLPILFLVEDNRYAISTSTSGKTFFDLPTGSVDEFYGLSIQRIDGADAEAASATFGELIESIRVSREPQLAVMQVERLCSHSNADDQSLYRDSVELARGASHHDPITRLRQRLICRGVSTCEIDELELSLRERIREAAERALAEPEPETDFTAKPPFPASYNKATYSGNEATPRLTMREAINGVLQHRLAADSRVFLYGQDIADPKGDVFGVTRGLSTKFPDRVVNAPLAESTIVGSCIGRTLAGQRPVAFIQFADFLPVAYNQIVSELGTMYWRTNGRWQCPLIVMVTCGGYKPGLGPFHAQTFESVMAHSPGIDVVMPSSAADAAGLLNAAFESPRPTIFFYPKSCLNLSDRSTSPDVERQFVKLGEARRVTAGKDLTLVTWGNPLAQCEQAARELVDNGFTVDLYDLRSLSPWDESAIVASSEKTGRLVVVHEDNQTCGFGAEVLAAVGERAKAPIRMRRITRPDTHIPYNYASQLQILPSFKSILEACAELLEADVTWEQPAADPAGQVIIRAIGSGPADEFVDVVEMLVSVGDSVEPGQLVAEIEATKSVVELRATAGGTVLAICAAVGDRVAVDSELIRLRSSDACASKRYTPVTRENPGTPRLLRREKTRKIASVAAPTLRVAPIKTVGIAGVVGVTGSRVVTNEELVKNWPDRTADEILSLTGIESRCWINSNESILSLAADATSQVLEQLHLTIHDVDLLIACTTTPDVISPSLACRVAAAVSHDSNMPSLAAYDISAACSGYLYALTQAYDFLQQQSSARVLVVTSEILSPLLDTQDFHTSILFGDAATATLVVGGEGIRPWLQIDRPIITAKPDANSMLCVPVAGDGKIRMQGEGVFKQAVRAMIEALRRACEQSEITIDDIDLLVPHQANRRILDAVASRAGRPVVSAMRTHGNTSSSTIPLLLDQSRRELDGKKQVGFAAFGAGFTSGAMVARVVNASQGEKTHSKLPNVNVRRAA